MLISAKFTIDQNTCNDAIIIAPIIPNNVAFFILLYFKIDNNTTTLRQEKREPLYLSLKAVGSAHNSKIRKAHAYNVSIHKSLQRIIGIFRCLHLLNFLHSQGLNEIANAILFPKS